MVYDLNEGDEMYVQWPGEGLKKVRVLGVNPAPPRFDAIASWHLTPEVADITPTEDGDLEWRWAHG